VLQRHARTLQALAHKWSTPQPSGGDPPNCYADTPDLNDAAGIQLDGVLFMEGEGRPPESTHLIRDLRAAAEDDEATGAWLPR